MKIFFTDQFVLPFPDGHRFPMTKYADLHRRLEASPWTRPEVRSIFRVAKHGNSVTEKRGQIYFWHRWVRRDKKGSDLLLEPRKSAADWRKK